MRHITLVKKIKSDGQPCAKCLDVVQRLENEGMMHHVNRIVLADDRDPNSEGLHLAKKYNVERAPFFIVTDDDGETKIYTVFFRFLTEVIKQNKAQKNQLWELQELTSELDFI